MPCMGLGSADKTLSGIYASDLVKPTDKMDASYINEKFFNTGAKWMNSFFVSIFTVF